MKYADLLQNLIHACSTHRWHQHQQLGGTHETVAHHSAMVAMIAHYLMHNHCSEISRYAVLFACLTHDLGEYWVGDVPSPTKHALGEEFFAKLDAAEARARIDRLQLITPPLTKTEQSVVHLADCLAGSLHCVNQAQLGNCYAVRPLREYRGYIERYCAGQEDSDICREALTMMNVMQKMTEDSKHGQD